MDEGEMTYLLNSGKWYRIARGFLAEINGYISAIPFADLELPDFDDQSEGHYCQRVAEAQPGIFALMDRDLVRLPGVPDGVEFCDLFTPDKKIVHLKRYGYSSSLSHLFAQGVVSGTLLCEEREFRRIVLEKLPATHRVVNVEQRPTAQEYEVVFGIISKSERPAAELHLPFFSMINLKNAAKRLTTLGFRVSRFKVNARHEAGA